MALCLSIAVGMSGANDGGFTQTSGICRFLKISARWIGYHACAAIRISSGVSRAHNRAIPTVISTALGTVNLGLERQIGRTGAAWSGNAENYRIRWRSEEHTSELQSLRH